MREHDAAATNHHQLTSLTELRSRVLGCDVSIARLSTDLTQAVNAIHSLAARQQLLHEQLLDIIHQLDSKVCPINGWKICLNTPEFFRGLKNLRRTSKFEFLALKYIFVQFSAHQFHTLIAISEFWFCYNL